MHDVAIQSSGDPKFEDPSGARLARIPVHDCWPAGEYQTYISLLFRDHYGVSAPTYIIHVYFVNTRVHLKEIFWAKFGN